jgi:hypothetical protein
LGDDAGLAFLRKAAREKAASAARKGTLLEGDRVFLETGEMAAPELKSFMLKQAHSDAVVSKVTRSMGAMFERIPPEDLAKMHLGEVTVGALMDSGVGSELALTLQSGMDAEFAAEGVAAAPAILDASLGAAGDLSEAIVNKTASMTYDIAMQAENSMALGANAAVAEIEATTGAEITDLISDRFIGESYALSDEALELFGDIAGTPEEAEEAIGTLGKIPSALGNAMSSLGMQVTMEMMTFWSPTSQNTLGLDPPTDGFKALEYSL